MKSTILLVVSKVKAFGGRQPLFPCSRGIIPLSLRCLWRFLRTFSPIQCKKQKAYLHKIRWSYAYWHKRLRWNFAGGMPIYTERASARSEIKQFCNSLRTSFLSIMVHISDDDPLMVGRQDYWPSMNFLWHCDTASSSSIPSSFLLGEERRRWGETLLGFSDSGLQSQRT